MSEKETLREMINSELKEAVLHEGLKQSIRNKCYGTQTKGVIGRKRHTKIGLICAMLVLAISGTVLAMGYVWGFDSFISPEVKEQVKEEIYRINKTDEANGVIMTVEEIMMSTYESLIVVSFMNQTGEVWPEDILCGNVEPSISSGSWGGGPPVRSEDGKKITYILECFTEDLLSDSKLRIEAKNMLTTRDIEEEIEIEINEFYKDYGIMLDCSAHEFSITNEPYIKMYELLKGQSKGLEKDIIIHPNYPSARIEGIGFMKGNETAQNGIFNEKDGLLIFTRNNEYNEESWWERESYLAGYISEVTDIRTGKVYSASGATNISDEKSSCRVSYFPEIIDESQIPYLKATKVDYRKQEVIVYGEWEVAFDLEKELSDVSIETDFEIDTKNETICIDKINLSTLGIQLEGKVINKETNKIVGAAEEELTVKILNKDNKEMTLVLNGGTVKFEETSHEPIGFISNYEPDEGNNIFFDIKQIKSITVGEQVIDIENSIK